MTTKTTEFKQADLKLLTPTRTLINRFADMDPAPGDRPLRDYLTKDLRRKYFEGKFRACLWASVKCKETKKEYRLNGKHSSKLFQSMNGEFKPYFKIEVEDWGTVDTLDEVSELYARYDPAKSARKTGDINRSVAATIPEIAEFSEMLINHCVSGIAFAKHGEADMSITTPYHRAEALRSEVPFVVWMQSIIGEAKAKDGRHLWRRPVGSAMYLTFHKCRKDATEFWNKVKIGEGEPASQIGRAHV